MKKQLLYIAIISVLIQTIFITNSYSASFIWIGTNSSSWLVSGNWSGGGGGATPGSGDNITLNTNAPNNLVLDQNRTVANFTINGDTVDLGTYTLTTTGVTYFNGGLVTNGNLNISGSLCHFGGATIDARTEANCGYYHMNGGTFLKPVILVSTGSASTSGTGNCIFSDSLSITHGGSYYFTTGSTYGDNFQNVTITNNSTREIYFGTADTTFISGNLILNNTSTGGIVTGNTGGVTYLASGKTITIGSSGFTNNYLTLKNFYQLGTTAQTLTLTGTGIVNFNNANFNGNLTVTSPGILLKNSTFNGTTTLTRNGSSGNFHSDGGNVFAELSYTNSGTAGRVRMASTTPDTYLGNVTFSSSGQDFQVAYSGENFFHGNVTINSNKVVFNTSSGKVTFSGGNSQSLNGSYNYPFKKLAINKSANHVTANTTLSVDDTLFFVSKNLITTSTNLLTMKSGSTASGASNSSFVLGPVKKVGSNGFQFPVGKNSTFRKVEITAPSNATDAFTAEYFDTTQVLGSTIDTTLNYVSNCGYWSLVRTTGSSNITPKFAFDSTHCDYLTVKPVHIAFWNGTKWVDKGLGDIDGEYRKTSSSQSSFGYFAFSYKLQTGDDYTMPLSINADSVCEATETILRNKKIWYSFTPDSTINTILINKTLMGSKNMAFIHTFSIYQSVAYAQKELVYKWYYGENDSLQSDITLYANLDTSKSYYIAIEKLVEADDCSFCDDDSTFLNICITNRNQNISVLNQLPHKILLGRNLLIELILIPEPQLWMPASHCRLLQALLIMYNRI
ncbi:MAG: hypothetical protein IPP71_01875 [Bacteroidetes bacterium]|nr:hypothetical protein [Bacteroidota bacterium]